MNEDTKPEGRVARYVSVAPFDAATVETMTAEQERYYLASQWRLIWWKLRRHRLAVAFLLLVRHVQRDGAGEPHHPADRTTATPFHVEPAADPNILPTRRPLHSNLQRPFHSTLHCTLHSRASAQVTPCC